jgi:sucrose-6-phosphate hydrolase SacC (GH32 family)
MKIVAAIMILGCTATNFVVAEESTRTAATTAANPFETAGTLISYNATTNSLVVATPESTAPITYKTNSQTELVDEANNPITVTALQDNAPVTVFYSKSPTEVIATRVIVRKVITAPR